MAVGDSLGAPFEGAPDVPPGALADLQERPGGLRWTDDTPMTIGVAESLVARRGFDGPHMAETFVRNFEAEPGGCALCGLSGGLTKHHLVPRQKDRKGESETIVVCRPCHGQIHALFSNNLLKRDHNTLERLLRSPEISRWVAWRRSHPSAGRHARRSWGVTFRSASGAH